MKRAAVGGAHRGPVAVSRQRRTLRLVQGILVLLAAILFIYAGYSWGRSSGFEAGRQAADIDAPRRPGAGQTIVLTVIGGSILLAAFLLQSGGVLRSPVPARLDELAGRAEDAAIARAEES